MIRRADALGMKERGRGRSAAENSSNHPVGGLAAALGDVAAPVVPLRGRMQDYPAVPCNAAVGYWSVRCRTRRLRLQLDSAYRIISRGRRRDAKQGPCRL